jgi:hypothetical protein
MVRALLLLIAVFPGCGLLFPGDPLDFRDYSLEGVAYPEAVDLVLEVVVQEFSARFGGGFETDWEPETGNLVVDGVRDDSRTLTLYLKLVPEGGNTKIEMLALVRPVSLPTMPHTERQRPLQDVHFEEAMYDAFVIEAVARAGGPS